jgi:hypothetical protein
MIESLTNLEMAMLLEQHVLVAHPIVGRSLSLKLEVFVGLNQKHGSPRREGKTPKNFVQTGSLQGGLTLRAWVAIHCAVEDCGGDVFSPWCPVPLTGS